jgi:single-strand DNA-binding protein
MSRDLNRCTFIGRLGKDPEIRYMPNGTGVANMTIAVGDDYKDKNTGEKVEQTEWVRLSLFGKQAENAVEYLKKGSKIYVEGKFKTRSYEKDDVTHYVTEIQVQSFQMLDSKPASNEPAQQQQSRPAQRQAPEMDSFDDDIPF